jgi:hypothetical protein
MAFRAQITDTALGQLLDMGLPPAVLKELVQNSLRDLAQLDRLNGYRAVAPVIFHTHRVVVKCPESKTTRRFLLWVDDCNKIPNTRIIKEVAEITSKKPYAGIRPPNVREDADGTIYLPVSAPSEN